MTKLKARYIAALKGLLDKPALNGAELRELRCLAVTALPALLTEREQLESERDSLKEQWTALQDRIHADFVRRTELEAEREEIAAVVERIPHARLCDGNCIRCQFDALLSRIQQSEPGAAERSKS
jgi:hypothetical protein